MKSVLRLFKAVEIRSKRKVKISQFILRKIIGNGFIFSPDVVYNYPDGKLDDLIKVVKEELGLTPDQINNSFHKSWRKIKEASIEQLVFEQIIHYITTYGFESLGIYDESSVYIPIEKLEIPDIDIDRIKLIVIKGYTKEEIKGKLLDLLKSGIALHEDTIKDVVEVAKYVGIGIEDVDSIRNKEVKIALCDYLKLFPKDPVEFLRYVVYKSIGKTLLIKDPATIEGIKVGKSSYDLFDKYIGKYGARRLATIFFRFKPIFLAFKSEDKMKHVINRLRKFANKYHKPMDEDFLNTITAKIKNGLHIDKDILKDNLEKENVFRKVRLAYALKYRTRDVDSILYKIRNGKGYATNFSFSEQDKAKKVLDVVLDSLVEDIRGNVEDKKIYIPPYIRYALPATEKQFSGDFPSGTCILFPKDMVFGVHWNNVGSNRIDLDLSLVNIDNGKIGWDSFYRTEDGNILFSGDMTDAPGKRGASELFYVRRQLKQEFILLINYYNYSDEIEVPFSIVIAKERVKSMKKNYMLDPNNVLCRAMLKINQKQKILGLLVTTTNECRFYFSEVNIGNSITSSDTEYAENSRKYLCNFYQNTISLNELLGKAGAIMVDDQDGCDIDLTPENLEKDKIIKLLQVK